MASIKARVKSWLRNKTGATKEIDDLHRELTDYRGRLMRLNIDMRVREERHKKEINKLQTQDPIGRQLDHARHRAQIQRIQQLEDWVRKLGGTIEND